MATSSSAPWRCSSCKQLRKSTALYCTDCQLPWQMAIDRSYVHGGKSPRKNKQEQEAYTGNWHHQQAWQWDQYGNQRAKSPRAKNRARSARGKKVESNQQQQPALLPGPPMTGAAMAPMAPMAPLMGWGVPQQMMQSPYAHPPFPPQQQHPDGSWSMTQMPNACTGPHPMQLNSVVGPNFTMPAMPKMPAAPMVEHVDPDLMTLLKQDVAELPPHIQKAVKESALKEGVKDGARATKDLHAAAKHLGNARKAYENAILARSQLHSNWRQFLSDAIKLWQDYSTQFTNQEQKLQEQVAATKEAFVQAKEASAKAHDAAGEIQEISDEELGEGSSLTSAAASKITETMTGLSTSLLNLQQQAAAIDAEEKAHQAKRPRTTPKDADSSMVEGNGGESMPSFGKAG